MHDQNAFINELATVFFQQPQAEALLAEIEFPTRALPNWVTFQNAGLYWTHVVNEVGRGRLPHGGVERLAAAARQQYPSNNVFRHEAEHVPEPLAETVVRAVDPDQGNHADPARAHEVTVWPTLTFRGAEAYEQFLRIVRENVDPQAVLLYAAAEEAAVLVPGHREDDPGHDTMMQRLRAAARDLGLGEDGIDVQFQEYEYRPHLLQTLRLVGPDQQVFIAENVPNTTPVRDIPHAVLGLYGPEIRQDRFGRTRRTVVDRVVPGGPGEEPQQERLDPDRTLDAAGVREGDELHIRPESTAGADRLRVGALSRVRNEIQEYESTHSHFKIVDTDDDFLPTVYKLEIRAAGFGPPEDRSRDPEELEPPLLDVHLVLIYLHDAFPLRAPGVVFEPPFFHPNILPENRNGMTKGWVCIGLLGDEAYRPDLDFYELCELITDIAAYRNYGAMPHGLLDSHGFLDRVAADWAASYRGQEMIKERGGRSLLATLGLEETPPPLPLRVRPVGAQGQAANTPADEPAGPDGA